MTRDESLRVLRIERRFDVRPEVVFDTLTIPEQMRVWWGEDAELEIELRVGGQWRIRRLEDGTEYVATGTYLQVERPFRLEYTFGMPQFSANSDTITIQIEPKGSASSVVFEHAGIDIAEELRALPAGEVSATESGWQQGFDLMVAAWSSSNG